MSGFSITFVNPRVISPITPKSNPLNFFILPPPHPAHSLAGIYRDGRDNLASHSTGLLYFTSSSSSCQILRKVSVLLWLKVPKVLLLFARFGFCSDSFSKFQKFRDVWNLTKTSSTKQAKLTKERSKMEQEKKQVNTRNFQMEQTEGISFQKPPPKRYNLTHEKNLWFFMIFYKLDV